jgi:F5/8 type C domain
MIRLPVLILIGILVANVAAQENSSQQTKSQTVSSAVRGSRNSAIIDKRALLQKQTFWDNRDWDWYESNIPFLDTPDEEINTTWYYRWELITKHLVYGSPNNGYAFTEFIDRPFWSGEYGAISCPAGHQLYEVRWLRDANYAKDYTRYWYEVPGAQPRNYSTWLADSAWAVHQVHPDQALMTDLLEKMKANYQGWEQRHFVPEVGLFWQTGHDDGMEFNINSRQTQDILRGAPGFRPTINAYMWADAIAISKVAKLAGDNPTAKSYQQKADALRSKMLTWLWDERRQFFMQRYLNDEERDGFRVKRHSLTHETGQFAGDSHGRELIGFVPWQFNMPDAETDREAAWKTLFLRDGFAAPFGPSTVERNDPMFVLKEGCCWWSGQSWPYATTQTLKALANYLQNGKPRQINQRDYFQLLKTYTMTHRKANLPYIAEGAHPDTGSWRGHDNFNHSEHYFHSGYNDLIITGLFGIVPQDTDTLKIQPLVPIEWNSFALVDLPLRGRLVSLIWDRDGSKYKSGAGFQVQVDGKTVKRSDELGVMEISLESSPAISPPTKTRTRQVNYAVNNSLDYFPQLNASHTAAGSFLAKANDGNYWYHRLPPNRWTTEGSPNQEDWIEVDLGVARRVSSVRLYLLDDRITAPIDFAQIDPATGRPPSPDEVRVTLPKSFRLEFWSKQSDKWEFFKNEHRRSQTPAGHTANVIDFDPVEAQKIRVTFTHDAMGKCGLTEFEVWGEAELPVAPAPPPPGNLALNFDGKNEFPKASCSWISRFDAGVQLAIDGRINFQPNPNNRWTSYESPNQEDWLEVDFGKEVEFNRVEVHIYDDRGGVQAPESLEIQSFHGGKWKNLREAKPTLSRSRR